MQLILCLFFTLINLQCALSGLRIIGGRDAYEEEFPYVVAMRLRQKIQMNNETKTNYEFFCSSSLLSSIWGLTAAHCIEPLQTYTRQSTHQNEIKGVVTLPDFKKNSEILESILHPSYKQYHNPDEAIYPNNDVALIRCEPMVLTRYAKLSALDFTTLPGHEAAVVGYGMKESGVKNDNRTLKVYKSLLKRCPKKYNYASRGICMSHACGNFATGCPGDSGGPILHDSGLVGVTSLGSHDCNSTLKSYANLIFFSKAVPVSPYFDWITGIINK